MKIVYLMVIYKNFDQFLRLVDRLDTPQAHFLIHIDRKVKDEDVSSMKQRLASKSNITYMDRLDIGWGTFALVQLFFNAFALLIENQFDFDFLLYTSGQDYPIKSNDQIFATLARNQGKQFLEYFTIPRPGWGIDGGRDRYERYHIFINKRFLRYPPVAFTSPKYPLIKYFIPHRRRVIPGNFTPYGGSAAITLSKSGVEYLYHFPKTPLGKQIISFFQKTALPDEVIFQTILMNSPLKDTVINSDLRCIDWGDHGPHPTIFTMEHFDILRQSEALFARKFDTTVDTAILDRIDCELLHRA